MALPGNVNTRTVTGKFIDSTGNPCTGSVVFTPAPASLIDAGASTIIMPKAVTVSLDGTGAFSTTLVCSDDLDLSPVGWTYLVNVNLTTGTPLAFSMMVPQGTGSLDLAQVVPAVPNVGVTQYLLIQQRGVANGVAPLGSDGLVPSAYLPAGGGGGGGAVASVNGAVGTVVLNSTNTPPSSIGAAAASRAINSGTGLTGGGDLTTDRTLAVAYGTASGTAAQGNDSRLSDARTPTAHAASHAPGGSDTLSSYYMAQTIASGVTARPVILLNAADTLPTGLPANTIIVRLA